MSMGALLGLATLYFTWRSDAASSRDSIKTASIFASLFYISGISAAFYPGSLAIDPEFGTGFPQFPIFAVTLALAFFGYWFGGRNSGTKLD